MVEKLKKMAIIGAFTLGTIAYGANSDSNNIGVHMAKAPISSEEFLTHYDDPDYLYGKLPEDAKRIIQERLERNKGADPHLKQSLSIIIAGTIAGEFAPSQKDEEIMRLAKKYGAGIKNSIGRDSAYDIVVKDEACRPSM